MNAIEELLSLPAVRDERRFLAEWPGSRYVLKNGRKEYIRVSKEGRSTTREVDLAARWADALNIEDALARCQQNDPTWRIVRVLDYRWN